MNRIGALRRFNAAAEFVAPDLAARLARRLLMRPRRLKPRDWELAALAGAERITFRFGLSGLRWGPRDAPVILMLHGWEGRPSQFRHLIDALVAGSKQVIALDGPAHGQSPGEEANPVVFAHAALEAAAEIRDIEAVVGHSMGAAALGYALTLGLPAQRAVLISGPSRLSEVLARFASWLGLGERTRARFLRLVERTTGIASEELDLVRAAKTLRVPALIVHDLDDAEVPFRSSEQLADAWPQSQLFVTQGQGHVRVLRHTAVIRRVTRFLLQPSRALLQEAA